MKFNLLSKRELEIINRKNFRYPLAVAEKDYFLALVMRIIYASPLKDVLVFKGGTAIYHCYLSQMRFSEDLDFTALDSLITPEKIKKVLETTDFLEIKKEFVSPATIKFKRVRYNGPLGLANSLKVEIDYKQNVVLPTRELKYKNVWKVNTKVKVMDIREICAEKIRAMNDRARYRDFYDWFMILGKYSINLKEVVELIKRKEIRQPISKASILLNWKMAREEDAKDRQTVYYSEGIGDLKMEEKLKQLPFKKIVA